MKLSLSSEMERYIQEKIRSGQYATADDVVTAGLNTLIAQETFGTFAPGELDELLEEGERSIEEHGTIDVEEAYRTRRERRANGEGAPE